MSSEKTPTVMIVEDDALIAMAFRMMLTKLGFEVVSACFNGEEAVAAMETLSADGKAPDVTLMDITLPGTLNGIDAAIEINRRHDTAIVFLTGYNQSALYDKLRAARYYGYLIKPVVPELARSTIEYAMSQKRLDSTGRIEAGKPCEMVAKGKSSGAESYSTILSEMEKRLVGVSEATRHVREEIMVMAPSSIPMLIVGETGTGKEIIARELYMASKRSAMPFLPVNCATLGTLADSELFGHVKGAFTGAMRSTHGYVGATNGGTLFLDEIEELSLDVQAKLLRFLDSGEYSKVGDTASMHANVRIISASNKNIEEMCGQGKFRKDLFFRLSGAVIHTTPLRLRRDDIPAIVSHFLRFFADDAGRKPHSILPDAMEMLSAFDWPDNARQLKQTIHNLFERRRQHTEIDGAEVSKILGVVDSVPIKKAEFPSYQDAMKSGMEQIRRKYFTDLLGLTHGKAKDALELSKLDRKNFYTTLKKLGMSAKDFK